MPGTQRAAGGGTGSAGGEATAGPTTIGSALFGSNDWFLDDITQGARQAADTAGATLVVTDAGWAGLAQASQVEDLVKPGVDAIIVATPWDPDPVLPAIEAAAAAGIPVLTIDRAMDGATSYIGTDDIAGSRTAGESLSLSLVLSLRGHGRQRHGRRNRGQPFLGARAQPGLRAGP